MTHIDLGPGDRSGVQATTYDRDGTRVVFIPGTDHWLDVLHHFLPFARRREIGWARQLAGLIFDPKIKRYLIGGHSKGGAVAAIVTSVLRELGANVTCIVYGPKRAPRPYHREPDTAYIHRNDWIPALPFWRPRYPNRAYFGGNIDPINAHLPTAYDNMIREAGFYG